MIYRSILGMLLLALLLTAPSLAAKRNVVLFVTDDQSRTAGCYGNPVIQTPNLDRLAEDGTLFTHAFATTASCSASRSVILSGLHNHRNGQYGHTHDFHHFQSYGWVKSLPVLMSEGGYRTAIAGKYHVAPDEVYEFEENISGSGRNPVEMADNARKFIEADSEKPFFLYFATYDPHRGGGVVEGSALEHKPNRFGNRPLGKSREGIDPVRYVADEVLVPPFLPDTPASRAELAQYYQSISRIDQGLGRLIQHLKEAGVYEDTLIIYTSDHGMAFPGGKTTAYEGGLRVPFVVRHPYVEERGVVSDAMISHVDITPSILTFAGVLEPGSSTLSKYEMPRNRHIRMRNAKPYTFHGTSWLPALTQEHPEGWDRVNASHTFHEITMYYPMRVVRERDWKLIWNIAHDLPYPFATDLWAAATWQAQLDKGMDASYGPWTLNGYIHRPEFQLFNMRSDPWESNNLADNEQYADKLAEMKGKVKAFQEETDDPWISKWEYE